MGILTLLKLKCSGLLSLESLHYLAKCFVLQLFFILELGYFDIPFLLTLILDLFPLKNLSSDNKPITKKPTVNRLEKSPN